MYPISLDFVLQVFGVIILVLANFYFVAAEFALVKCHPSKLQDKSERDKFGTRSALRLIDHLDDSLSATQLGITIVSLVLGWYGEEVFASMLVKILEPQTSWSLVTIHGIATTIALLIVTFLHVVIGELAAKSLAIRYPENTVRFLSPSLIAITKFLYPAIVVLNSSANLFLSIFGLRAAKETEGVFTAAELAHLVEHSSKAGALDKSEESMLKNIFSFSETIAREIMTPRTDLVTIHAEVSLSEALKLMNSSGFSRLPVVGDNIDDVKGILLLKDIMKLIASGSESLKEPVGRIMRQCYFVPGTKPLDSLLTELREKTHMAVVIDEYGGVDGVVTLEDIIEEVVGEIDDESDYDSDKFLVESSGDVVLDGGMLVDDVNQEFDLELPKGEYDTIAGFILHALGRVAYRGDIIIFSSKGRLINLEAQDEKVLLSIEEIEKLSEKWEEQEKIGNHENSEEKLAIFMVTDVDGNRVEAIKLHKEQISGNKSFKEIIESLVQDCV